MDILFFISLCHGVVVTVLLRRYYHIFFTDCRVSTSMEWVCYGLTLLVATLCSFISTNFLLFNFFVGFITKYLLTFIYRASNKLRIALPLIFMLVIAVFEIGLMLMMIPASASLVLNNDNVIFHTVGPLYSVIFMYVFVFIVEGIKSTKTGIRFTLKYWICFALTPLITFMTIVFVMSFPGIDAKYVGICTLLMLALNLVSFYFYEIMVSYITSKMERQIAEEKNLYYAKQLETLTALTESLRSYQHDMKNHAIVADAYFQNKDYDKVRRYYYEVMRRPLLENAECISGNTTMDSFFNYKMMEAKNKGVVLDLNVAVPEGFSIPTSNLVVVFGNLIDNAIEAASNAEDKTVKVRISYAHHCVMMKMKNHYIGTLKTSGTRFLTTKENAILHGYGLKNVKRIIDENGGTIAFHDEDNVFTVNVLMYDKE